MRRQRYLVRHSMLLYRVSDSARMMRVHIAIPQWFVASAPFLLALPACCRVDIPARTAALGAQVGLTFPTAREAIDRARPGQEGGRWN